MARFGGKPSGKERPSPSKLKFWRTLKLNELWKSLTEAGADAPRGTPAKKNRTKRRRARTVLTKRLKRSRRLKGQNARTGR
jgi:hypothetical protein